MSDPLEPYENAFDRSPPGEDTEEAWQRFQRALRRNRSAPMWRLVATFVSIALCVAAGLAGIVTGWGVAGFLVLVVLPERWRERDRWRSEIAAVGGPEDLRILCARQARTRMAGLVGRPILLALLAVAYLVTALVAWLLGRSPLPGSVAAVVVLAWAAFDLLVRLPIVSREMVLLDADP